MAKRAKIQPGDLVLRLQPKQWELGQMFERGRSTWIGYGGSRGGAKSGGLRRVMIDRRLKWPGTTGLIFRRVYAELKANHIDKMLDEWPVLRRYWRATDHEIVFPSQSGEAPSKIVFGYAETFEELKRKFHGLEFMDIMVDQGEQLSEQEHRHLKTSCRWPGVPDYQCKYAIFFNPGGIGLPYLKRVFGDRNFRDREVADDYAFIQAYGWDNVEWVREALKEDKLTEKDFYAWDNERRFDYFIQRSQYGRDLNALPEALRIGHLLGSLDVFAGQYFDNFDPDQHVLSPSQLGIKSWHSRWISMDWGFAHDSVIHWHASEDSVVKTYRERVFSGLGPKAIAQEIISASRDEKLDAFYLSPDAFAKRTTEDSIAEQIRAVFLPAGLPSPARADDDRVGGWMLMREMLQYRRWLISSECAKLIETLPLMSRDDKKVEDCCFVAGTLIVTRRGMVPIEEIDGTDEVMTRKGWKVVRAWGMTQRTAKVYTLRVREHELTGTGSHPVWTQNRGWVPLRKLLPDDILLAWKSSFSTASNSIDLMDVSTLIPTSGIPSEESNRFIGKSGNTIADRFRQITTFITKWGLRTASKIWSAFVPPSMEPCTCDGYDQKRYAVGYGRDGRIVRSELSIAETAVYPFPPDAPSPEHFARTSAMLLGSESMNEPQASVSFAGTDSSTPSPTILDSAPSPALTVEPAGSAPVYNLEVSGCHEYIANGILVHNCKFLGDDAPDCARYGLKTRMGDAPVPHDVQLKGELDRVAKVCGDIPTGDLITNQHIARLKFEHKFRKQNRPWKRASRFARA